MTSPVRPRFDIGSTSEPWTGNFSGLMTGSILKTLLKIIIKLYVIRKIDIFFVTKTHLMLKRDLLQQIIYFVVKFGPLIQTLFLAQNNCSRTYSNHGWKFPLFSYKFRRNFGFQWPTIRKKGVKCRQEKFRLKSVKIWVQAKNRWNLQKIVSHCNLSAKFWFVSPIFWKKIDASNYFPGPLIRCLPVSLHWSDCPNLVWPISLIY